MRRSATTQHILAGLLCYVGILLFYTAPAMAQESPTKANEGTFTPANIGIEGVASGSASWGDLQNDGDPDLLVTGVSSAGPFARIYENDGDGTFQSIDAGLIGVGGDSDWGDYDGDGDLDVVVTGLDSEENPTATIYRNDGGEFSAIGTGLTGVKSSSVAWGDYDSDGDLDLAITGLDGGGNQTAKIYRNEGGGSFQEIGADLPGVGIGSVDWGDFDGDDDLDLAITGRTSSFGQVTQIYRNDGGSFQSINAGLTGLQGGSVSWGDFDGDGDLDLVTTGYGGTFTGYRTIVYENQGSGTFQAIDAGLFGVAKNSSTDWADFNGDGHLDLAISGSDGTDRRTIVYRNEGDGTFQSIDANLTGVRGSSVDWGDYDGDGDRDLVVSGRNSDGNPTTRLYENEGSDSPPDLEDGLIAYYPFNGNANDESGNENTGTLKNNPQFISGVEGKALELDGQGDHIEVSGFKGVEGTTPRTVSFWFKSSEARQHTWIYWGTDSKGEKYVVRSDVDGEKCRLRVEVREGSHRGTSDVCDGEWHLLTVVFPKGGSAVQDHKLYVDGILEDDATGRERSMSTAQNADVHIGHKNPFDPHDHAKGSLDDFRIYDRALSEPEVQQLFDSDFLAAPADLSATPGDGQIELDWKPGESESTAGYNVYRSTSSFSDIADATKLNGSLLSDANYPDREVTNGTEYFYRVTAVGSDGNESNPSAEVKETPRQEQPPGSVSFTEAGAGLAETSTGSTSIADINEDGNQDLLVTGSGPNENPTTTLYLGDGQGGFTEAGAGLTGVQNSSTSIADVDGDGNKDLLITGDDASENQTATLYLGDGEGGFTKADAGLTGVGFGSSTSIADVNKDGNPDLLITGDENGCCDNSGGTATLYLGDGQGGFTEAGAGLTGVSSSSTSIADVNKDGNPDLLITGQILITAEDERFPATYLYLGDGQGGFTEAGAELADVEDGSTSIADVDGDGNKDLLITGNNRGGIVDPTAALYLGDGQGGFTEAGAGLTGVTGSATSIADVDGDGNQDLLVAGDEENFDPSTTLYLGDGQGGFTEAGAGLTGVQNSSTSIADVDGDGNQDLLVAGDEENFDPSTTLYLNQSSGEVQPPTDLQATAGDGQIDLTWNPGGDSNPDGYNVYRSTTSFSDIADATKLNGSLLSEASYKDSEVTNGTEYFYRVTAVDGEGNESGLSGETSATPTGGVASSFSEQKVVTTGADSTLSVHAQDLDGDGDADVLSTSGGSDKVAWYENQGGGEFSDQKVITTSADGAWSVYAQDLDGDGDADVLSASFLDDKVAWYENQGGGEFSGQKVITTNAEGATSVYAQDLDGDGDADVLSASQSDDKVAWYENQGGGEFSDQKVISANANFAQSVYAQDLDGDGDVDVLFTSFTDDKVAWYENQGGGEFSGQKVITTSADGAFSVYAQDVNGDGDADVLSASSEDDKVAWYENQGGGEFSGQKVITTSVEEATSVYAQDLDGDGDADVLSASQSDDKIAWYENQSGGGFSEQRVITTSADGAFSVYAQDVNGDGDADVLSASWLDDKIAWYENKGTAEGGGPKAPTDLQATAGDGQVDLAWNPGGDSNPDGYNVYRSTTSFSDISNATKLNGSLVTSTSYPDTDVTNGTKYFYRVTAVGGEEKESDLSGEVAATPPGILEENVLSAYSEIAKSVADTRFGRGLQEEYENQNIKHLGLIQAGLFDLLEAGVFIDLDDYFGITEEGQNDYVTVWLNASGSIGVSLLPFDLGIIRTKYTEGIPDPRGGFDLSLSEIRAGAIQVEAFTKMENGEVQPVSWEFNESFVLNASASFGNTAWQFYQFEMKRDVLNDIVEASLDAASPPTTIGQFSGDILFNLLFDFPESPLENPIPEFDPAVDELSDVRFLTRTDDGDAPEIASTINYGRGGMDTDDDGFRDNKYPIIKEDIGSFGRSVLASKSSIEFNLKFTAESKEGVVTDYGVSPIEIPDGWYIKPYKDGEDTLPNIADREWNANDLSPGESVVTRWQVSSTDPTQSPVQIGFELYEDKAFSDTPLDTLYVEFKQEGSFSVFAANPTITGVSNSSATSSRPKAKSSSSGSLVDSTRDTPFRLSLETPSGETISPTSVDLTESHYVEADFDSSGTIDAQYVIANPEDGNYSVKVEPHSDTPEGTRVTIEAITSGTFQTVARDQPVPDEGSETYPVDTDPLSDRPARTAFDVQRSFGDASDPSDYRLVALPGALDRSLGNIVDGKAGTDWTAFWDSGASEDFLVEYDGSETFTVRPGRGFWLTNRESWTAQDSVDTVQLGNDRSASVPLHDGWNIISNPLSVDVAWSDVQQVNSGSLQPVWSFDGSFAQADTFRSAKTGEAFYFLNDAGRDSLFIPYSGTSESKSWRTSNEKKFLSLTVRPRKKASPTSTVRIGFDRAAKKGLGPLDQPAPPGQFSALSLWLEAPGNVSQRYQWLGTEQRPPNFGTDEGETFDLLLRSKAEGPVQITTEHLEAVEGAEAKLLHPSTGRSYNLVDGETVVVREADSTTLRLAIGSETFVQGQAEKIVPDEVTLTSYPNPVRKQATLEYTLPEAKEVRLTVYDVLGRRVATMERGRKQAGRHRIRLQGNQLSSGVYFGRLQVGDQTRTQKITVVR